MKTIIFIALLLMGGLMIDMHAQTHLRKWVEKAETVKGVDYTIISKKDIVTKEMVTNMISISFKDNPILRSELYDAASKDKKDAIEIIENKSGGVLKPQIYKFYDETKQIGTQYIFSESKNGTVSLVINTKLKLIDG